MRLNTSRFAWLSAASFAALLAGGCTFDPRYPIEPGRAPGAGVEQVAPRYAIDPPASRTDAPAPPRAEARPRVSDEPEARPASRAPVDAADLPPPQRIAFFFASHHLRPALRDDGGVDPKAARGKRHGRHAAAQDDEETPRSAKASRRHGRAADAEETAQTSRRHRKGAHARDDDDQEVASAPARGRRSRAAAAEPAATVEVGEHDTLYSLSRKSGLSVDQLAKLNGLKAPYTLHAGDTLKLPPSPSYTMRKGDTLDAVADRFGVDVADIRKVNGMTKRDQPTAGDEFDLPSDAKDAGRGRHAQGAFKSARTAAAEARGAGRRDRRGEATAQADDAASRKGRKGKAAEPAAVDDATSLTADLPQGGRRTRGRRDADAAGTAVADLRTPSRRRLPPLVVDSSGNVPVPIAPPAGSASTAPYVPAPSSPPAATATERGVVRGAGGRDEATLPSGPVPYTALASATPPGSLARGGRGGRGAPTARDAQGAAALAGERHYASIAPLGSAEIANSARGRFIWPVQGEVISGFGPKGSGLRNDGVDLAAQAGDAVHAAAGGEVVYAGNAIPGFGNLVLVKHPGGWVTAYGHLARIAVAMRQTVRQGDAVGEAGQTGAVDRTEVHFEIRYAPSPDVSAKPVDPAPLLPRRG
jgi:murein DD-endopeptidase MepM/ murein hydrolase activator NlpD